MEINMQGGVRMPQTLPGARSVDFPVKTQETKAETPQHVPEAKVAQETLDTKREARLQQAIQSFQDVYAVSDTKFAIFKDSQGQYITRITSLRDGRVTYIPEPQMLQHLEGRQQARQALVELQA